MICDMCFLKASRTAQGSTGYDGFPSCSLVFDNDGSGLRAAFRLRRASCITIITDNPYYRGLNNYLYSFGGSLL